MQENKTKVITFFFISFFRWFFLIYLLVFLLIFANILPQPPGRLTFISSLFILPTVGLISIFTFVYQIFFSVKYISGTKNRILFWIFPFIFGLKNQKEFNVVKQNTNFKKFQFITLLFSKIFAFIVFLYVVLMSEIFVGSSAAVNEIYIGLVMIVVVWLITMLITNLIFIPFIKDEKEYIEKLKIKYLY
ncbi:hypothetical protein V2P29_00660 [Mesomycoplasma hyorhinis]|uniref:hypothetical protein n=1 Tax=Mesomycoplasma hyorhinis TaxID=2100 RepID=UPI0011B47E53|nr:hypothetical protein EIH16_02440 [Mesomycoplasma hyorhinis]